MWLDRCAILMYHLTTLSIFYLLVAVPFIKVHNNLAGNPQQFPAGEEPGCYEPCTTVV